MRPVAVGQTIKRPLALDQDGGVRQEGDRGGESTWQIGVKVKIDRKCKRKCDYGCSSTVTP